MKLYDSMVKLSGVTSNPQTPIPVTQLIVPDEPPLPNFHKLSRTEQEEIADHFLRQQELSVFKAYVMAVANRSTNNQVALKDLRGTLVREIIGLENLRKEFEGPGTPAGDEG